MSNGEVVEETSLYGFEFRDIDNRRSGREGCHDIKQLWQRTHEILDMILTGMKGSEVARILGISPVTVSNAINSTLGRQKLAKMREERDGEFIKLNEEVRELTEKALATYHEVFDDESGKFTTNQKLKVTDTVALELSGLRAPTRIDSRSIHTIATLEEIEGFKSRGLKAAKESGMLIEVKNEGSQDK